LRIVGALIYKIESFKMRKWEIYSKVKLFYFKLNYLRIKIQKKGNLILKIIPYRAFVIKADLIPNIVRLKSVFKFQLHTLNYTNARYIHSFYVRHELDDA